ncbi:hypothetical protein I4U23_023142 [Adineta vaga]|nr:hypothetical protein I4U23_023142 [Adineta vaga]
MHSFTEPTLSSSAKKTSDEKRSDYLRQHLTKSPTVHPMPSVANSRSPSKAASPLSSHANQFKYMIMMGSEKNNQNDSLFRENSYISNNPNASIEGVVFDIINKDLGNDQTKSLPMKIAVVSNNKIVDDYQKSIDSVIHQSSSILYILIIPQLPTPASTTNGSLSADQKTLIQSFKYHSFSNANHIFIYHANEKGEESSTQSKQISNRFFILRDVHPELTLELIRKKVKEEKLNDTGDQHIWYNRKCLTTTNESVHLEHFRNQYKIDANRSIISFHLQKKQGDDAAKIEKDIDVHFDAFILFIRLSLEDIIFNEQYAERMQQFFTWCDRDKSNTLERQEVEIGLLTILKLMINTEEHQSLDIPGVKTKKKLTFTAYDLLPICDLPTRQWTVEQFKCLLLDTLVEHSKYNCLFESSAANQDLKSLYDDVQQEYLKPLKETISTKLFIPKISELKIVPWKQIFKAIGIAIMALLFLPIFVFYVFRYLIRDIDFKGQLLLKIVIYAMVVVLMVLSIVMYIDYVGIIIYHYFASEINYWNITFLEAYWPFVLHVYAILMLGMFCYHNFIFEGKRQKQLLVERRYEDSRYDVYAKNAVPIPTNILEPPKDSDGSCKDILLAWLGIFIYMGIAITRVFMPEVLRKHASQIQFNPSPTLNYTNMPWTGQIVLYSYWGAGLVYNFYFYGMILAALVYYIKLATQVNQIMASVTNNDRFIEHNSDAYYNLKKPTNVDYFLSRFKREVANTDSHGYYLATISYALVIDAIFILIAAFRLLFVTTTVNALTVLLLVDIICLSEMIIAFVMIVASINQRITTDAQQLIKRTITETTAKLISIRLLKEKTENDEQEEEALDNGIEYLSAMADFIENEKKSYCIYLFHLIVIDMDIVIRIAVSALVGIVSNSYSVTNVK